MIVTRDGWTKRQKSFTDVASIRVRDDDRVGWVYRARARQTLTFFTDRGIAYTMRVNDIPMTTGHGEPIQKQFAFEDQEHIVSVICHDPRCLPDWTKHPQTPPRLVQRLLGGDVEPADDGDARSDHDHESGEANGNGAVPSLPPPPYAIALTAGGKVLRFALAPLAAVSTRKGRLVVRLDPSFKGDLVVGVEATDGSENVCLATRSARVLIFPVTEANVVGGAARGVNAIRLERQGPRDRLRSGQQETRGPDRPDQSRGHADRAGHQVSGHLSRRQGLRDSPARLARRRLARRGRADPVARRGRRIAA